MGWLLTEIVLVGFRKVPFTCTYFPGRSRVRTLWPCYLVALIVYAAGTATAELAMLAKPSRTALFVLPLAATIAALTWIRARLLADPFGLRFEEEDPDALFGGFRFSEGWAGSSAGQLSVKDSPNSGARN
jgi:hypothetical protein